MRPAGIRVGIIVIDSSAERLKISIKPRLNRIGFRRARSYKDGRPGHWGDVRRWIVLSLVVALPVVFFADRINRSQVHTILVNAAKGKPPLQHVAFVFPLIPHPTPSPTPAPVYPDADQIVYGNDVPLKYEDLGSGYWQTASFNMVDGSPLSSKDDWQGQFRFKYNPPDDPLHPGASIVAIAGARSKVRFADLGNRSFYGVSTLKGVRWLVPAAGETPAAWHLHAGDVVAMKLETDVSVPVPLATSSATGSATSSAAIKPRRAFTIHRLTFAKVFIRELSQDTVRFDYVYRTDGSPDFPKPHDPARD